MTPSCAPWPRRSCSRSHRPRRQGGAAQAAAPARPTPTTAATSSSRCAPAPAARRRRCSPPRCCACTPATPRRRGWRVDVTDLSEAGMGGVKEAVALIEGDGAFSRLKYESGVHRVQRVPATEASGRIHTSAVTVAVLARGRGGRDRGPGEGPPRRPLLLLRRRAASRSTRPTRRSASPTCRPASSCSARTSAAQQQNRLKAMRVLKARLYEIAQQEQQARSSPPSGARWSAPATARRRSAPTTSRSRGSPTTASASPSTASRRSSTATSTMLLEPLIAQFQAERLKQELAAG